MLKVVLSYPMHPEHGLATVPFPIPSEEYDRTLQTLVDIDIGDTLEELMRDASATQYQREQGMQMGEMA